MQQTTRRILYILVIWVLLTGKTVIRCSSGDDDFDAFPPDEDNRPPVASDAFYQISSAGSLNAFMRATDPDGDALSYRVTAGPRLGSLRDVDSRSGQFTYLPGSAGSDSFSFKASDGRRDSNTAVISIRVGTAGSGAAAKSAASGLPPVSALMADPGDPDALWIRWSPPAGGLQRIVPDGQAG
ncbi:MAG: Ig-like domain-containing protein, partial [Gammaproteobacteria bacterium]